MNDIDFKKKIEERLAELPESLSLAIKESNWERAVFDIGNKYNLHIDDIGILQNELILVLTGIVHPDEFKKVLTDELGLDVDKSESIISDINEIVNQKIKDKIKKILEEKESSINEFEKDTLKNAGVGIGEEEDLPVEPQQEKNTSDKKEEEEFVEIPDGLEKEESETGSNSNLNTSIFKTKTSTVEDKNEIKIDPYREPIE